MNHTDAVEGAALAKTMAKNKLYAHPDVYQLLLDQEQAINGLRSQVSILSAQLAEADKEREEINELLKEYLAAGTSAIYAVRLANGQNASGVFSSAVSKINYFEKKEKELFEALRGAEGKEP